MKEESKTLEEIRENSSLNNGKKNHTAIIALIILVLVVAVGFRGYYFYKKLQISNPVKATAALIKDFGNSSKESMDKYSKFFNGKKPIALTINGDVGDIKFNIESGLDLNNKIITALINMSGMSDDELYLDGTVKAKESLFKVSKDGDSYIIKQDISSMFDYLDSYFKNLNGDYSKRIVRYLAESFEETFTKDDFTKVKEKSTPVYGDKEVTTTKYTTTIDGEKLAKLLSTYLDKLANDEEFIDSMVNMTKTMGEEITKEEILESFEDIKDELKDPVDDISIKYVIETYKSQIISATISTDGFKMIYANYNGTEGVSIEMEGATIEIKDSKAEFVVSANFEDQPVVLNYDKKTNEYDLKYAGAALVSGTYEEIENKNSVEVKLTISCPLLKLKGNINSKMELVDSLKDRTYKDPLDIQKGDNANKLLKELEGNEFIETLYETIDSMFYSSPAWDSIDGFEE